MAKPRSLRAVDCNFFQTEYYKSTLHVLMILLVVFGTCIITGIAQHEHVSDSEDSASHHGRSWPMINVAVLPPPPLMKGVGSSALKITTKSNAAQAYFNQGLNLMHCFWDMEAYRAFKEAARQDSNSAMAYWGIFVSTAYNAQEMAEERKAALAKAVELSAQASDHEQFYVRASALQVEQGKGRPAYINEMETLIDKYPDDIDAQLLLANSLSTSTSSYAPDGRPRDGKMYGKAILRNLLITHPDVAAVHHYWIHAVENGPRPEDALESCLKLPMLAPNSGHILHMPGHIYYRIGEYDKAYKSFMASMQVDDTYMKQQNMNPIDDWNYVHNLDYLVANCAEDGRLKEGMKWANALQGIPIDTARLKSNGLGYILYGGHTSLARLQMRYGFWDAAVKSLQDTIKTSTDITPDSLSSQYYKGMLAYAVGMDALDKNKVDIALEQAKTLDAILQQLSAQKSPGGSDWYFGTAVKILAVHSLDLHGSILSGQGQTDQSIAMLEDAAQKEKALGYWEPPHYFRPVLESLGAVCIKAGKWDQALDAYQRALKLRPNSGDVLFGIARTYALAGRRSEAAIAYKSFLNAWKQPDSDLPQVKEAKAWLGSNAH